MPDYKNINNALIIALCEIIDKVKEAIEEAEENIISDEANEPNLHILHLEEDTANTRKSGL